jgi:hypothetical protein
MNGTIIENELKFQKEMLEKRNEFNGMTKDPQAEQHPSVKFAAIISVCPVQPKVQRFIGETVPIQQKVGIEMLRAAMRYYKSVFLKKIHLCLINGFLPK